jgi:hypothetical protein
MSLVAPAPTTRTRPLRDVYIRCSHCTQSVQVETFKRHVLMYWEHGSNTWFSLPDDCTRGNPCEHDHRPSAAEMVHINQLHRAEQAAAKRRRTHQIVLPPPDPVADVHAAPPNDLSGDDHNVGHAHDHPNLIDIHVDIDTPFEDLPPPVEDPSDEELIPGWMSYHPGAYTPPCSVTRINQLVANYNLADADVQDVYNRVDMLTLYIWYIRGNCSVTDMGLLLVNRSFGGTIPFIPHTVDGLRTYLGFLQGDQEQGWDEKRGRHWEFQQIISCSALGCARCVPFSSLVLMEDQVPTCDGVEFPNHPHERRRDPCGTAFTTPPIRIRRLLTWKPSWLLYYKSPIAYIRECMTRVNYPDMNEQWRNREPYFHPVTGEEIGCDFYDFGVWDAFHQPGGRIDWTRRGNCLLMGNMDWYAPFKHTTASLGLVWMVNLCIPRAQRYKRHNVMLVAVLPGLSEKELRCDRLLEPLARDLLANWNSEPDAADPVQRVALAYITSDAPALRKFSGFGAITSSAGCLCCHKIYARYINANGHEQQEYHHLDACRRYRYQRHAPGDDGHDACATCHHSGSDHYDRDFYLAHMPLVQAVLPVGNVCMIIQDYLDDPASYRPDRLRTRDETTATAVEWRDARTNAARKRIVHECGITWTSMYLLPYFDPTTMVGIDGLHHIWHGVVQSLLMFWLEEGIISQADMELLQAIIHATPTPYDIGAMHTKLLDRFSRMSAADQMQFVLVYSDTVFPHYIDGEDLNVWRALSHACRLLSQTSYTPSELDEAERAAYEYNRILSVTYHGRAFAPKTHEITHCARTIRLGGPHHVNHTFMFEGLNGRAMQIHNNVHQIQLSIMRRWTRRQTVIAVAHATMRILHRRIAALTSTVLTHLDVQPAHELARLRGMVNQLEGALTDMGPDLTHLITPGPAWFNDRQLDYFIRLSQEATHDYGTEFLPGGIIGALHDQPLGTEERKVLAHHWQRVDEMVATSVHTPGRYTQVVIPTRCAVRGWKLSIGGEVFTSTAARSQRSSYIITALIGDDGMAYDQPCQVLSYVEIRTDAVPVEMVDFMHPSPVMMSETDSPAAHLSNYRRHIAMQEIGHFDLFVELDASQETYIAKRRTHCYAFVTWFLPNGNSALEWQTTPTGMGILPVHRIKSRFTPIHMHPGDTTIFEILPIPRRIRLAASYAHDD